MKDTKLLLFFPRMIKGYWTVSSDWCAWRMGRLMAILHEETPEKIPDQRLKGKG
jgi:hypothetical protein